MQLAFNGKILLACFLVPFLAPFPMQLLRHALATGYGGYFDQPGLGWVVLFGCIMGGLAGAICACLYLAVITAHGRNPLCLGLLVSALLLAVPLIRFQSNDAENARDHFIRLVAYELFYAPFAHSTPSDAPLPTGFPVPLPPNTRITVPDNEIGSFSIETGQGTLRTYSWARGSRTISMIPITSGKNKQLNFPTDLSKRRGRWPGFDWIMHDGIARCCSLEQVLDFDSEEKAVTWIREEKKQGMPFNYRNDGLVVLVSKHIESDTLWIMVRQLLINGHKPHRLPGADDAKIVQVSMHAR